MKTFTFTIYGNQENESGNPIPYFRSTQGGQFNKGAKRYHAWKDYVRAKFMDAVRREVSPTQYKAYEMSLFTKKKPIPSGGGEGLRPCMTLLIMWANKAHADCDNVFKGIADALFVNDKYLVSNGFSFQYSPNKEGSVTITLTI